MKTLTFQHDIGDKVYLIINDCKQTKVSCKACSGNGYIFLENKEEYTCPKCYGSGYKTKYEQRKYRVAQKLTIEQQDATIRNSSIRIRYMCKEHSDGRGSGSLFESDKLFKTKKEALDKCKELNDLL